ncbi:MAG: hypothetical protein QF752_07275 [Planctomycetota bacterium]|jgi:hypothetical protein|nr:hypothetical protein [Planctomycetota bacterium]
MVEFKNKEGKLIRKGLVDYQNIYHLATVTVVGTLREEGENYFMDAVRIHVNSKTPLDVEKSEKVKKKTGSR